MLIGYDIGGTNARVSAIDSDGRTVLGTRRARLRADTSPEGVAARMAGLLEEVCEACALDLDVVEAIGVGLAGQLLTDGRTVFNAPNLGWRDLDFASVLEQALPIARPVRLVNDLNALLWGEVTHGAARGHEDVLAVYVGTGVGGAIVSGGRLLEGAGGKAGEIGHIKIERGPGARRCGCGERGCLEAYVGGVHLERLVGEVAARDPALAARIEREGAPGRVDLGAADALADEHDEVRELFERAADALARAVANACTILNPGLLLLGGGVWEGCAGFRDRALMGLPGQVLEAARVDLRLADPALGDLAGMLGAADLARRGADQSPNH